MEMGWLLDGLCRGIILSGDGWFTLQPNQIRLCRPTSQINVWKQHCFVPLSTQTSDPKPVFFKGYVCLKLIKAICIK